MPRRNKSMNCACTSERFTRSCSWLSNWGGGGGTSSSASRSNRFVAISASWGWSGYLIGKVLLQCFAGPREPHFAGADGQIENRGQLFVVVSFGILEDQHGPILFVQNFQHVQQVERQAGRGPLAAGLSLFPLFV